MKYAKRRNYDRLDAAAELLAIIVGSFFGGAKMMLWLLASGFWLLASGFALLSTERCPDARFFRFRADGDDPARGDAAAQKLPEIVGPRSRRSMISTD